MDINTELFTVTGRNGKPISLPMAHVVTLGEGRFDGWGSVTTTAGGAVDTKEPYQTLVSMWYELTKTV